MAQPLVLAASGPVVPESWTHTPSFSSRSELLASRRAAARPHASYDVDGDGVVSHTDYWVATRFDSTLKGKLDATEVVRARQAVANGFMSGFHVVKSSGPTASLSHRVQQNPDGTLSSSAFDGGIKRLSAADTGPRPGLVVPPVHATAPWANFDAASVPPSARPPAGTGVDPASPERQRAASLGLRSRSQLVRARRADALAVAGEAFAAATPAHTLERLAVAGPGGAYLEDDDAALKLDRVSRANPAQSIARWLCIPAAANFRPRLLPHLQNIVTREARGFSGAATGGELRRLRVRAHRMDTSAASGLQPDAYSLPEIKQSDEPPPLPQPFGGVGAASKTQSQLTKRRRADFAQHAMQWAPLQPLGIHRHPLPSYDERLSSSGIGWWQDSSHLENVHAAVEGSQLDGRGSSSRLASAEPTDEAVAQAGRHGCRSAMPHCMVSAAAGQQAVEAVIADDPFKLRTVHCRELESYQRQHVKLAAKPGAVDPWVGVHSKADLRAQGPDVTYRNLHQYANGLPGPVPPPRDFVSPLKAARKWGDVMNEYQLRISGAAEYQKLDPITGKQMWLDQAERVPLYSSLARDGIFREPAQPSLPGPLLRRSVQVASAPGAAGGLATRQDVGAADGYVMHKSAERATIFTPSDALDGLTARSGSRSASTGRPRNYAETSVASAKGGIAERPRLLVGRSSHGVDPGGAGMSAPTPRSAVSMRAGASLVRTGGF
jgi:hypothetical protein